MVAQHEERRHKSIAGEIGFGDTTDSDIDEREYEDTRPDCIEYEGSRILREIMNDAQLIQVIADIEQRVADHGERYANKIHFEVIEPKMVDEGEIIEGRINFWRVNKQSSGLVFSFDMHSGKVSLFAQTEDNVPQNFNGYQSRTRKQYFASIEELIRAIRFGIRRFEFDQDTQQLIDAYLLVSGRVDNQ